MKRLIITFLFLLFAVWLGFMIHRDPGYLLITYEQWSVETSLWVGVIAFFLLFIIFYGLLRLLHHTSQISSHLGIWNKERRERKAGEMTNIAFEQLVEMRWNKAEDLFSKSAKSSTCSIINYSAAAFAAQQQLAFRRRNKYLSKLSKQLKPARKTALLVEAYFYIQSKQWKEAMTLLTHLEKKYPNDPAVLRFLTKTYENLGNWEAIETLLPRLERHCDPSEYEQLQIKIICRSIENTIHPEPLKRIWDQVPKSLRNHVDIVETLALKSRELNKDNDVIPIIENALKKNWEDRLVKQYGSLKTAQRNKQISHAESWLKKHPNDSELLLCLGKLCQQEQLWGKASDYLNKSAEIKISPEVYFELGQLAEARADESTALKFYRKASTTQKV